MLVLNTTSPRASPCAPAATPRYQVPSSSARTAFIEVEPVVLASEFSLLGSCSRSVPGSTFDVRRSTFGVRGTRTRNAEPEHEPRTEKTEVRTTCSLLAFALDRNMLP